MGETFAQTSGKDSDVYGEVMPFGGGKMVALASLMGLRASGIELSSRRHGFACKALGSLRRMAPAPEATFGRASLVRGSFFDAGVADFSETDIVFVSSVCFSIRMMGEVSELLRGLRVGAQIVTFKRLEGPWFRETLCMKLPVSWQQKLIRFHVFERVDETADYEETDS